MRCPMCGGMSCTCFDTDGDMQDFINEHPHWNRYMNITIWVKASVKTGTLNDQLAKVLGINGNTLTVELLGNHTIIVIGASEVCGIHFDNQNKEDLSIFFEPKKVIESRSS